MSPSQITPLVEAAYHLKSIKDQQAHALDAAMTLVDRLPFTAIGFHIDTMRHNRRIEWGVLVRVNATDVALFPELAIELGAKQQTDVHSTGGDSVTRYEMLVGSLAGIPFEITAYMGTQRVEQVAA